MTLQDLGALGELVGAIAVVVSLIYVASQIRQSARQVELNSRQVRASMYHATNDVFFQWFRSVAENAELAEIWRKGTRVDPLEDAERLRFESLLAMLFLSFENNHEQLRLGAIDRDTLAVSREAIVRLLQNPHVRRWWDGPGQSTLTPAFREAVEALVASTPG